MKQSIKPSCPGSIAVNVLMVTSEWPTQDHPEWVPFIVQQVEYLRKAGVTVEVFSFRGSKSILNYLNAWLQVRKKLGSERYDLVHAHFGQSGLLALPRVLPLVVTFHGSDLQGEVSSRGLYTFQGNVLRFASKIVALLADEVVMVSSALGRELGAKRSFHVIPCGLDLDLFKPMVQNLARQQLGLPEHKKLVLFGGRPEIPVKRAYLAGQVVRLIEEFDVEMIVVNNVPHHRMPLYLNACDALLLTSIHEGSPTIIKEGLACNLPIVSTDVGDVRERIGAVEGCIVCEDDRPETLAKGLSEVLRRNRRVDGRSKVLALDEKLMTEQLIAVYHKALQRN